MTNARRQIANEPMTRGCFNVSKGTRHRVRAGLPTPTNQLRAFVPTRDAVNAAAGSVFVWVNDGTRRQQRRDDHRIVV
jgi:hypothetical protein